ncbi:MAG: hypothetical protein KF856_01180 [Cyclobacteriaceae bacterium]|nr:hypothetical protein [Cyclobacteriaceae bacterium]MBX2913860.1 hypothetical protein [Cyclobacteriaceae bacterium]
MKYLLLGLLLLSLTYCTSKEQTHYTSGQSKNELMGTYTHSSFMYSYTLILKDSSKYLTIEKSDIFSERTLGTWTISGKAVRLNPQKRINTLATDRRVVQETSVTDSKEEVVIIETADALIITSKNQNLKLEREK